MTIEYKHDGRFILNMQSLLIRMIFELKGCQIIPILISSPDSFFSIIFNFNPTLIFQLSPQYSTPPPHICISSLVISLVIDTQNDGQALNR